LRALQNADPPSDCGGPKQLFLPELPEGAAWLEENSEAKIEKVRKVMRAVVQRVSRAKVTVEGRVTGEIGPGLMVLLGVGKEDNAAIAKTMAEKVVNLRIFEDQQGKMNLSLLEVQGSALVVSQFTLYGDARGQRRPSFISAGPPELAKKLYGDFCEALRGLGVTVGTGIFQAMMSVELVNEGPVTILLDSDKTF
jgi:D-tyrosyl-tRNA(Tyr) deacylase